MLTDREIDVLVADKCAAFEGCDNCGEKRDCGCEVTEIGSGLPYYTTDPAASKQLRDKMWADGWWCQLRNGWTPEDSHCWAGFTPHGVTGWNGRPDNWTEADTEERAVALAALKAKGVEIPC